jgi:hypothetical protein
MRPADEPGNRLVLDLADVTGAAPELGAAQGWHLVRACAASGDSNRISPKYSSRFRVRTTMAFRSSEVGEHRVRHVVPYGWGTAGIRPG